MDEPQLIEIDLTPAERKVLIEVLEDQLSELRMEIADTDSYDFRENLKHRKDVLLKTLETLRRRG